MGGSFMLFLDLRRHRKKLLGVIAALLLIVILWQSSAGGFLLSVVSSANKLVPIYAVDTPKQAVSISFDASWGAEHTLQILDILDKHQVKTTFFLVNIWLQDYPEMAREIVKRGHEIGLHSVSHPHFPQLSEEKMTKELQDNQVMIKDITGFEAKLFRPPFGDYNNMVIRTCENLDYKVIQWSIDSLDWKDLSAAEIQQRVLKKPKAGDIILFHNNGKNTAEALPGILEAFKEKGLEVIPISDLLLEGDYYVDQSGIQRSRVAAPGNRE